MAPTKTQNLESPTRSKKRDVILPEWQVVFDSLADSIFLVDGNQIVQHANPAGLRLLGKEAGQVTGKNIWWLINRSDQPPAELRSGSGRKPSRRRTMEMKRGDAWLEVNVDPVARSGRRSAGFIILIRDITQHKQADEVLRLSEKRYRTLAEEAQEMIFIVSRSLLIEYVNGFIARQFGLQAVSLIGKQLPDLFSPEVFARIKTNVKKVFTTNQPVYIEGPLSFSSHTFWLGTWLVPLPDDSGRVISVMGVSRDLTSRKATEDALAREQDLMHAFMETVPEAIYFKDTQSRFIKVSKALAVKHGKSTSEEILGSTDFDFFEKESAQTFFEEEQKILKTGKSLVDVEEKETWPDRPITWALTTKVPLRDRHNRLIGTIGVSRDITERKRSDEALREAEARYRALVEKIPAAVYIDTFDEANPVIYYISPRIEQITGYPPEEWTRNPRLWTDILHPEDRQRVLDENTHSNRTNESFSTEYRVIARGGNIVWIQDEALPIQGADGKTKYWQGILLDITERKRAEEEQRALVERISSHESAIAYLATQGIQPGSDFASAARVITSKVGQVTGAERVSIWLADGDTREFRCVDLYQKGSPDHIVGQILKAKECQHYFESLNSVRVIVAHEPQKDARLRELNRIYLKPQGITSVLHASVMVSGKVAGVVALEQMSGPRLWELDELAFAREVADQVAYLLLTVKQLQSEADLSESRQMLRTILDTIPVRVFWKDRESKFLGCNRPFALDAGLNSPQEIIGKDDYQMGWNPVADLYRTDDRMVIESGQPKLNFEEPQMTPDGRWIWLRTSKVPLLDAEGRIRGVLGTYDDITDRIMMERALRASEEKARNIIEQASEGFSLVNEEGVIIEWNHASEIILGVSSAEAMGKYYWDIQFHISDPENQTPERLEYYKTVFLETFRTGQSPLFKRPIEAAIRRPDGEITYIEQTIFPVKTYQGYQIASLTRDITMRKQAEESLQRQLKEFSVLHAIALAGTQADSLDKLVEQVTHTIGEAFNLDNIGVQLIDETGMFFDHQIMFRSIPQKKIRDQMPLSVGIAGRVATTRQPARVDDVRADPDYFEVDPETCSELCVPLEIGGKVIGVINAESHQPKYFSQADELLLVTVAGGLATAVEKQRLFEAERTHHQEAEILRQAAAAVTSSLELRLVLETILTSLKQVVPYDRASVILLEEDQWRVVAVQGFLNPEQAVNFTFPTDDVIFRQSQHTRKPIILEDAMQDLHSHPWAEGGSIRGWMAVPLLIRETVIGHITLDSLMPGVFNEKDAEKAFMFAQQAAVAIENARLYEQAVQATDRWAILHQASQEIARASQDPEQVYIAVHKATGRLMPAEAFAITLVDSRRQDVAPVYLVDRGGRWKIPPVPYGRGLSGQVITTGKSLIIPDLEAASDDNVIHFGDEEKVRSILAVPLRLGQKVIGMLSTQSYQPYAYNHEDQVFLEMLAAHAAVAIENSRLYAETRHRLTELEAVSRISTALRSAQTVEDMLPLLMDETLLALETDAGAIDLYDPPSGLLKTAVSRGWFTNLNKDPVTPGEGITGKVFLSNQALITQEFATDSHTRENLRAQVPPGWGGVCIPIRTMQETIGVMFVSVRIPRQLQADEIHLLETISEIAGNALRRADLHQQTERQVQRLASLRAIDTAISTILDLRVTLGILIDHVSAQLKVDAVDVLLLNPNTQTLEHAASTGFRTDNIKNMHLYVGEGLGGQAVRTRGIVYIPNLTQHSQDLRRQVLTGEGFVTYLGIPLIAKGNIKGVLEVYSRTFIDPDAEWRSFLETLAGETAIAVDNAALFEELQRTNLDLSLAYDATIEGWSKALDLRDQETEGHTLRVTEKTLELARMMEVSDTDLVHIRRGALLHDIGKMGVPDTILYKTGELTEREWEIMHRHPILAYEMLAPISYLRYAIDIPYCHHEAWNGTGYPRGLKSDQIPLSARIFAVVDVWDALTSDRPYRVAWNREAALEYIRSNRMVLFDPLVVDMFVKMIDREQTPV